MNQIYQKEIKKIIISFLIFIFFLPLNLFASENQNDSTFIKEQIRAKQDELYEVRKEIDAIEIKIEESQKEQTTLQNESEILGEEIKKTELEIQETNLKIENTKFTIERKIKEIQIIESEVSQQKEILAGFLREIYEQNQVSFLEIILEKEKASDFFNGVQALENVQEKIRQALEYIKISKEKLEVQKGMLEREKNQAEDLKKLQEEQRITLDNQKKAKEELLVLTKGREREFQKLFMENKNLLFEIQGQIFRLQSLGAPINFEEAKKQALEAAFLTNVRPAFLLGILKVESNLGTNVGGGRWKEDMSPRQWNNFFEICKELGIDPDKTPVSKKPTSYEGWGGAMGPAQFMPSIWQGYKQKVSKVIGHYPPDPWNLRDALTAMALKLSRVPGVSEHNFEAEYEAAGWYFAGSRWRNFTWYSDKVMWYAEKYEGLLKN
jgi:peptidoglycan hydrolase CwlO-like protein